MSDPTIPELPRCLILRFNVNEGTKPPNYLYRDPDWQTGKFTAEPLFTASQMRSMYLQGWRDRGEVDAKACEERAIKVYHSCALHMGLPFTMQATAAPAVNMVCPHCEADSVVRSIPEPKEGK